VNEFRAVMGLPPDPEGDIYLRTLAMLEVPASIKGHPRGAKAKRTASVRVGQSLQKIRRTVARKMEDAIDSYFSELAERVVERAGKVWRAALERKDLPEADDLLKPSDSSELKTIVRRWYVEIIKGSWDTWNGALGVEVAFDLTDPAVTKVLATAGTRVGDIDDTTLQAVRDLLQFGNEQGWSIDQLVRGDDEHAGLRDVVEQTYKNRAQAIARTELGEAQNMATTVRYQSAGIKKVEVLDNGADDDDEECRQLNGTTQTLEWAARNTLQHPNCTRAFAPVVGD